MSAPTFTGNSVSVSIIPPQTSPITQVLGWTQIAGDTLILEFSYHAIGITPSVVDTAGNNWVVNTPAGSIDSGNGDGLFFAMAIGIKAAGTGTNTVTISWTGGSLSGGDYVILEYTASGGLDGTPTATIIAGASPVAHYTTVNSNVMAIEMGFNNNGYTAATSPWTDRTGSTELADGTCIAEQAVVSNGSVLNTVFNGASNNNCIIVFAITSPAPISTIVLPTDAIFFGMT